jgi:hypothetical protein
MHLVPTIVLEHTTCVDHPFNGSADSSVRAPVSVRWIDEARMNIGRHLSERRVIDLLGVATTTDGVIVEAEGPGSVRCPSCRHQSVARHSRYWRTIKDLAAYGQAVILGVRVGRWRRRFVVWEPGRSRIMEHIGIDVGSRES